MAEDTYLSEDEIILEFVRYLEDVQGLSHEDALFGSTGFPDPYSLPYLFEEYVEDSEIDGATVEVRDCWTDFSMMMTLDNSRPFRFRKYIFTPDDFDRTVGSYRAAKKLYALR